MWKLKSKILEKLAEKKGLGILEDEDFVYVYRLDNGKNEAIFYSHYATFSDIFKFLEVYKNEKNNS